MQYTDCVIIQLSSYHSIELHFDNTILPGPWPRFADVIVGGRGGQFGRGNPYQVWRVGTGAPFPHRPTAAVENSRPFFPHYSSLDERVVKFRPYVFAVVSMFMMSKQLRGHSGGCQPWAPAALYSSETCLFLVLISIKGRLNPNAAGRIK
jgi:hypothetical protein